MRIVVCIGGASGAVYARRILQLLCDVRRGVSGTAARLDLELHYVASGNAEHVWRAELGEVLPAELDGAHRWARDDFAAPFASGSSAPDVVVCVPCSMSLVARVAHGGGDDLIARTCDVALKERRRLLLVVRETPLSLVHLRNLVAATESGATVIPAVPSFYGGVRNLDDAIDTVVARVLDHAGVPLPIVARWGQTP